MNCKLSKRFLNFSRKLVGNEGIEVYQRRTMDPYFKGAAVGPLNDVLFSNQQNSKNFTLRILPEIILSVPTAMLLPKNHFLTDEIYEKVNLMQSAGLIDYWVSKYLDTKLKKVQSDDGAAEELTVEHLRGGFLFYGVGCLLAFVSFVCEVFGRKLSKLLKKL